MHSSKTKCDISTFLLEILGFIHNFMTGKFNPNYLGILKLQRFKQSQWDFTCIFTD